MPVISVAQQLDFWLRWYSDGRLAVAGSGNMGAERAVVAGSNTECGRATDKSDMGSHVVRLCGWNLVGHWIVGSALIFPFFAI